MVTNKCSSCKQCGGKLSQQYMGQSYAAYGVIIEKSFGKDTPGMKGRYTGPNLSHFGPGVNPGFAGGTKKSLKKKRHKKKNAKKRTKRLQKKKK
jgi:hypothetical protein